jgi:hypothetical protein
VSNATEQVAEALLPAPVTERYPLLADGVDHTHAGDPAATACVLDDAGHVAHVDRPAVWLAAVSGFLGGGGRGSGSG